MIYIHDGRTEARGPLTYCRYQRGVRRPDPLRKPPVRLGFRFLVSINSRSERPSGARRGPYGAFRPIGDDVLFFGWPYSHDESLWSFHHGLLTSDRARWTSIEARWALIGSQRRRCFFFVFSFSFLCFCCFWAAVQPWGSLWSFRHGLLTSDRGPMGLHRPDGPS